MKNLNKLMKECMKELDKADIPYGKHVRIIQDKAKRRWGCCKRTPNILWDDYIITISPLLCNDNVPDKYVKKVIIHELLHTCSKCMCHTGMWKAYAHRVKDKLGYDITRLTSYEELGFKEDPGTKNAKYVLKCQACGITWNRFRKSRFTEHPENYHCPCGGRIKNVTVKS